MLKTLKRISDKVRVILEKMPSSRDCDKTLTLAYLNYHHGLKDTLGDKYDAFKSIWFSSPSTESIRRARQKLQENGEFQGLHKDERMDEAQAVRKEIVELKFFPRGLN